MTDAKIRRRHQWRVNRGIVAGGTDPVSHGSELTTSNTGYAALGLALGDLSASGSITTSSDGQVIYGRNVTGRIRVSHHNVTIQGCKVNAPLNSTPIQMDASRYGLLVEYCELHGPEATGGNRNAVDGTSNVPAGQARNTIRRCNIHHTADGGKAVAGWSYIENYVHTELQYPGEHNDGFQCQNAANTFTPSVEMLRNRILLGSTDGSLYFGNSAVYFNTINGDVVNVDVKDNWLQVSSVTVAVLLNGEHPDNSGVFAGVATITGNKIVQGWNGGPQAGISLRGAYGTVVATGNRYVDVNGVDQGSADP